ncbi:NAD(P)H:quinone oxidoreductase, type IV [Kwoniella dendrophila CBS 6074]|uniref:NAD(P)H:quinone oxidoreductase, type IV n=1 Tax=Kwoniella dendrophila CBS 6074 TaxID=1295534 RepID=A0AAX4JX02_9TREE
MIETNFDRSHLCCWSTKAVIAVAFYSTYGHIDALAAEVIKGAESTGAIVKPYVIQETLPQEVLTKMYANTSLQSKYPAIKPEDLKEIDGLILGAPTRYGRLPSQVDAFFDHTGGLWAAGGLVGKFATLFTSAAGQHSGHESTALTTFPFFAHHGMSYVPIGYSNPLLGEIEPVQGGSPYGASTVAGADGSLQPTATDLKIAEHQGKYFANFVGTFVKGRQAATSASTSASAPAAVPAGTSSAKAVPDLAPPLPVGTTTLTGTSKSGSEKIAGEPVPAAETEKETNGYSVNDATEKSTADAAPAQASGASTPGTTKATATPAEKATPTEKAAPAPTPAPAATTASVPAKKAEPKPKKKGFFSCCGDSGIDK